MTSYNLVQDHHGYGCVLATGDYGSFTHVKFTTYLFGEDTKHKAVTKSFDLFLYPEELDVLILSLQDCRQQHTQEVTNE